MINVVQIFFFHIFSIWKVYTGPYKKPQTVSEVDDIWQIVTVDGFVAVSLENYNKVPVIAKVIEKNEDKIKVHYWKGSWNKKWVPWMCSDHQPWLDDLPKGCVYLASFELDDDGKLQKDTKRSIRGFLSKEKDTA